MAMRGGTTRMRSYEACVWRASTKKAIHAKDRFEQNFSIVYFSTLLMSHHLTFDGPTPYFLCYIQLKIHLGAQMSS